MTVIKDIDVKKIAKQKEYVSSQYADNKYFKDNPNSFFWLWHLLEEHKEDWYMQLNSNVLYSKTNYWLNTLFQNNENAKKLNLNIKDIVKIVMNNIFKFPKCKCDLK